jgi:hypothetical protein
MVSISRLNAPLSSSPSVGGRSPTFYAGMSMQDFLPSIAEK